MTEKNSEKPTQTNKSNFPDSKYIRSRTLGDIRAEKKMKEFCANLKAFDNPIQIGRRFWEETLTPNERDTKMYFKALSRELFDLIGLLGSSMGDERLKEGIDLYLLKFKEFLEEADE